MVIPGIRNAQLVNELLLYRNESTLYCEGKRVVPKAHVSKCLAWSHEANGHPGAERTVWFCSRFFYAAEKKTDLLKKARKIKKFFHVCKKSKPSSIADKGIMGSLPIPQLANDTLYIDFIQLDPVDQYNYVLTMVDSLTRFCKFVFVVRQSQEKKHCESS